MHLTGAKSRIEASLLIPCIITEKQSNQINTLGDIKKRTQDSQRVRAKENLILSHGGSSQSKAPGTNPQMKELSYDLVVIKWFLLLKLLSLGSRRGKAIKNGKWWSESTRNVLCILFSTIFRQYINQCLILYRSCKSIFILSESWLGPWFLGSPQGPLFMYLHHFVMFMQYLIKAADSSWITLSLRFAVDFHTDIKRHSPSILY